MAARAKKTASSADVWLVDGLPKAAGKANERVSENNSPPESPAQNIGPETRQWLAIPAPPGGATSPNRQGGNGDGKPARGSARRRNGRRKKHLSSKLGSAEKVIAGQRDEIETLQGRLSELESELANAKKAAEKTQAPAKRSESRGRTPAKLEKAEKMIAEKDEEIAELTQKSDQLEAELADARKGTRSRAKAPARSKQNARRNGSLDLNSATFEQLRSLGLSTTQSARMIAHRDVRGGYESLDELDGIPGLAEKKREELKAKLRLGD